MKLTRPVLLVALLLGACATPPAPGAPHVPAGPYHKANAAKLDAWIMLLRLRNDLFHRWKDTGQWPDDPAANAALDGHVAYWQRLLEQGTVILTGGMKGDYWDNVALIVFEAPSQEEAERLMKDDPAVKAYVFEAQVRPFDVHWISDKWTATP
jgi:uncharacterized protein YciI